MTLVDTGTLTLFFPPDGSPGLAPRRATPRPVDHLDFYDICAILLGISFTIAKLDAQGRKAENFPAVAPADFEQWRLWTVAIYRLGSSVCFLRVLFHQLWVLYAARFPVTGPTYSKTQMLLPLAIDALFLGGVTSTFLRANRARARRRELGIVLSPLTPQQSAALAPETEEERKAADRE